MVIGSHKGCICDFLIPNPQLIVTESLVNLIEHLPPPKNSETIHQYEGWDTYSSLSLYLVAYNRDIYMRNHFLLYKHDKSSIRIHTRPNETLTQRS